MNILGSVVLGSLLDGFVEGGLWEFGVSFAGRVSGLCVTCIVELFHCGGFMADGWSLIM